MKTEELIAQLMDKQKGQGAEMRVLLGSAAGTIENLLGQVDALKAELRDERHRHDRYVDFELEEAEELRKLKEQLRWISVKDRLPAQGQEVIVYSGGVLKPTVFAYQFWNKNYDSWARITHWMPLPEPLKGE